MLIEMDPIEDLVTRLNSTKKLRVWSVIITFFGDAIVPRGEGVGLVSARTCRACWPAWALRLVLCAPPFHG